MMPITARLLRIFIIANNITTKPAVLKKTPDQRDCPILCEVRLKIASTGKVPSAKTDMMSAPFIKLPAVRV